MKKKATGTRMTWYRLSISLPKLFSLPRCGRPQPGTNCADAYRPSSASSTAPNRIAQPLFTDSSPRQPAPRRDDGSVAARRAVDLGPHVVGQHLGVRQGADEVDQRPHVVGAFEDLGVGGGHGGRLDAAGDAVVDVDRPPAAAVDALRQVVRLDQGAPHVVAVGRLPAEIDVALDAAALADEELVAGPHRVGELR